MVVNYPNNNYVSNQFVPLWINLSDTNKIKSIIWFFSSLIHAHPKIIPTATSITLNRKTLDGPTRHGMQPLLHCEPILGIRSVWVSASATLPTFPPFGLVGLESLIWISKHLVTSTLPPMYPMHLKRLAQLPPYSPLRKWALGIKKSLSKCLPLGLSIDLGM